MSTMHIIENERFDQERALYGSHNVKAVNCAFDGPADGESAFKESSNIEVVDCFFNLRYPFWHDVDLRIINSEMTELCRAALWYSKDIVIQNTKMHGIKALRECEQVRLENCDIVSPEFGWSVAGITMNNCKVKSEYFLMRSSDICLRGTSLDGKYSLQYVEGGTIEDCCLKTKDSLWHAHNVTVKDSVLEGEYFAWYSDGLTLVNCVIRGTQPFCYCKNLTLIDCVMEQTDLSFEKSDVQATVISAIDSVKNPRSGSIAALRIDQLILDDPESTCSIIETDTAK